MPKPVALAEPSKAFADGPDEGERRAPIHRDVGSFGACQVDGVEAVAGDEGGTAHAAPTPQAAGTRAIRISGRWEESKCWVELDDRPIALSPKSFEILTVMALARRGGDGWVHKIDLGAKAEYGWRGISRLRAQLQAGGGAGAAALIANDGAGSYRVTL